jgi:hypothetical protein
MIDSWLDSYVTQTAPTKNWIQTGIIKKYQQ